MYTAELVEGKWSNWQNAGERLNSETGIGESISLSMEMKFTSMLSDQEGREVTISGS